MNPKEIEIFYPIGRIISCIFVKVYKVMNVCFQYVCVIEKECNILRENKKKTKQEKLLNFDIPAVW
jgi:hypothetical protein